jgi:hypothetical protein
MEHSLQVDWIALWKISHRTLFESYIIVIVPTMFVCSRRLVSSRPTIAGLVLSGASFVVVMRFPIGALAWVILESLVFGEAGRYSLFNAIPFAALMALGGATINAIIIRWFFKEPVGKKEFGLLYAGNAFATTVSIGVVLILLRIYPPQVLA